MNDTTQMAARFEKALANSGFDELPRLMQEYAADDFVAEWPQSGERLTKAAARRMAETYAEMTGTNPSFTYRRMLAAPEFFVMEGTIDYGDAVPVSWIGIAEVRDGKVTRMTEYFANPFEAPAWRAGFVDRIEPTAGR